MPLPAQFLDLLEDLRAQAAANARAARLPGVANRRWQLPSAFPTSTEVDSNVQDPQAIASAVPRDELNCLYVLAFRNGALPNAGRVGELMGYKGAVDYAASFERVLHGMLAGHARCLTWASARRAGHGDADAGVFKTVADHLESFLEAAQKYSNEPVEGVPPVTTDCTRQRPEED